MHIRIGNDLGRVYAQNAIADQRLRHRPGLQGTHLTVQLDSRSRPVHPGLRLLELVRIGGALCGLRRRGQTPRKHRRQFPEQEISGKLRETIVQRNPGRVHFDRRLGPGQDRARIQSPLHLHQADPRLPIAGQQRPLHRCGTAPARQQRGVQVDRPQARGRQNGWGQNKPVGNHHHEIQIERAQMVLRRSRPQGLGLPDRNASVPGQRLHRADAHAPPPTGRPIRLRQNHHRAIGRVDQRLQRGNRKGRRTGEGEARGIGHPRADNASAGPPAWVRSRSACFSSFLRIRLRLSVER